MVELGVYCMVEYGGCYHNLSQVILYLESFCVILMIFFKQKTAYEMESRDWSSDVCSSD
eukprot:COSAG05_NODE_23022_length_261_cov_0.506173_1_plen_58_part_01